MDKIKAIHEFINEIAKKHKVKDISTIDVSIMNGKIYVHQYRDGAATNEQYKTLEII